LGGCASLQSPAGALASEAAVSADAAPCVPWWTEVDDPLLARLIDNGLAADPLLRREASALADLRTRSQHWRFRLARWIGRMLQQMPNSHEVQAVRLADARQRKAARIARAYVEVRRLQANLALRQAFQDRFDNDADFARWRYEAGLVSAVDGGLAASLIGTNASALADTRARLAAVEATLARRAAVASWKLGLWVNDGAQIPWLDADGAAAAACDDAQAAGLRAALADVRAREAALPKLERDAERTADDARAAYRLGTGDFATLYVAQTAVLAVREARVAARARRARTAIDLWTDAGLRRNQARLREPARRPAGESSMAAGDCRG
jgi:outer membrane protein TolC